MQKKLQVETNKHRATNNKLDLNFFDGWVVRFESQYRLTFRKLHVEVMKASSAATKKHISGLLSAIITQNESDSWNGDKSGLFYRQLLGSSLSVKSKVLYEHMKDTMKIRFHATFNSNRTERMPLINISKAARLSPFKRKLRAELGFD